MIGGVQARRRDPGSALLAPMRWLMAIAVVVAVHGGATWLALGWKRAALTPNELPPAMIIDLAPIAVAPEAPPQEIAPGPRMTEAQPEPPTPELLTPEPPTPAEQEMLAPTPPEPPKMAEIPPEEATPTSAPEIKPPEVPQTQKADAVLTPPPPPPKPEIRKNPTPNKQLAERKRPIEPDPPKRRQTSAPASAQAPQFRRTAAPPSGASASSAVSPASWKGELVAHLNRYKRFPPGASGSGTVAVSFTISRSGQVLSARLAGSSGDAALDAEAASLPRRASPVPAPPAGFGGGAITLSVPIRFSR